MFKLFIAILKDERGIAPLLAGSLIAGGSSILGGLFGKKKKEVYDPYAGLRSDYNKYAQEKLGTTTPYQYQSQFELPQPGIEKQAEQTIAGKLGQPTSGYDPAATEEHYQARKARMEERFGGEQEELSNMYNRLGLVSSTPGLEAMTDLRSSQGLELEDLSAQLMYEDIAREMEADRLLRDWTTSAQVLGGAQTGRAQFPMQMSMADIERQIAEEQGYASQFGGILGGNPPQVSYQPNTWSQLAQTGQDVGGMMAMQNILGGGGGTPQNYANIGGMGNVPVAPYNYYLGR